MNIVTYSISDLEKLTGIKAHTIRIWEKRYAIISPERTDTNIRFYSVGDLQRLLNIVFLNKHGIKISLISTMTDEQIQSEVARLSENPGAEEAYLANLVKAITELDEDRFEHDLNSSILKLGFEKSFEQLVFPLIEKVSLLWQIGKISSCQERFVNNLIRQKLVVAIDGMTGYNDSSDEHYLLYLPAGEYDEINLLYTNFLLRKAGHHVIYLGPSIPVEHLRSLSSVQIIDHVIVSINQGFSSKDLLSYAEKIAEIFPDKKLYMVLIGQEQLLDLPISIQQMHSFQELAKAVAV